MDITITSDGAMKEFGRKLGAALRGSECIELVGDVGAGKTTLAKGIALGMGINDTVQSPTFTISRNYSSPSGILLSHYDFYRLADAGIMADELQEVSESSDTVIVIEWGDVVRGVIPEDHLRISFESLSENERQLTFSAHGEKSSQLLEALKS